MIDMKILLLICSGLLLLGLANLPIEFYTFLRIIITIGSVAVILTEHEKGLSIWVISFGLTAILFNPIIPIHLNNKDIWMPIDLMASILFLVKAFVLKTIIKQQ